MTILGINTEFKQGLYLQRVTEHDTNKLSVTKEKFRVLQPSIRLT